MFAFQSLLKFWRYHPALLYGSSFLLGFYAFFFPSYWLLIPLIGLWLPFLLLLHLAPFQSRLPFLLSLTLFLAAYSYAHVTYCFPSLPPTGLRGTAHFSIQSLKLRKTPFGSHWLYQCHLNNFFPDEAPCHSIASNLKCLILWPQEETTKRPLADHDYLVQGTLIFTENGDYLLKTSKSQAWLQVKGSWSLAEKRYQWKKQVSQFIKHQFSSPLSGLFLAGLATGEFDAPYLQREFARFGLQHIMAISGFHFAIIAGLLNVVLQLLLPRRLSTCLLLILMGSYCFFLGNNPSVLRAYTMSALVILGYLMEKSSTALNLLGVALLIVLMIDPLLCQMIGFQFSFLTTAAILLTYQSADTLLCFILPKRSLSQVIEMNILNQHGYCLLAFFRQGLALTLAVNLFALPLMLFYFNQFPWMSLLYNLFFPLLITGCLGLLIMGCLLSYVPFIGAIFQNINNTYTHLVLKLTYQLPASLDHYLIVESFPLGGLLLYITAMIIGAILLKEALAKQTDEQAFTFI